MPLKQIVSIQFVFSKGQPDVFDGCYTLKEYKTCSVF